MIRRPPARPGRRHEERTQTNGLLGRSSVRANDLLVGLAGASRVGGLPNFLRAIILGAIILFFTLIGFFQLYICWAYGHWEYIYFTDTAILACISLLFLGGCLSALGVIWWQERTKRGDSLKNRMAAGEARTQAQRALLAALATPNDDLMPLVPFTSLPVEELTTQRQRVMNLPPLGIVPNTIRTSGLFLILLGTGIESLNTWAQTVLSANAQTDHVYQAAPELSFNAVWVALLAIGGVLHLRNLLNFSRPRLFVNQDGLWWRDVRWVHLPWAAIRSIAISNDESGTTQTYLIAGEKALLTWRLPRDPAQNAADATLRLLSVALHQSGQPLRRLTALVRMLTQHTQAIAPLSPTQSAKKPKKLEQTPFVRSAIKLFNEAQSATSSSRFRLRDWALILIIAMVCFGPFLFSLYVYQDAWPKYLAALPTQIQARQPMLYDSLLQPDKRWPVQAPTSGNQQSQAYSSGGYALSNGDGQVMAMLPETYHAVAVQVTLHISQTDQAESDFYDYGAGIIIRGHTINSGDYYGCAFVINAQGDWWDSCSTTLRGAKGHTAFIHTDPGATNALMAVARGQFLSFYINDHFVGSDFFSYSEPFGQIGLINTIPHAVATFSDFTVWSLKPLPQLWLV